jgi:hypothetical protein
MGFTGWTFLCYLAHFNNYHRDLLSDAVYYKADRPFVQRTLLPTAVNLAARLVPRSLNDKAVAFVKTNPAMQKTFTIDRDPYAAYGSLKLERNYPIETGIALCLILGCLCGFVWVTVLLYDECYGGSAAFRAAVPSIAAAGIVPWLSYTAHFYDFVSLLLFATSLLTLKREAWRGYLLTFGLACINKETAVLNTLVFATYMGAQHKLLSRFSKRMLAAQIGIYLVVQSAIVLAFRHNRGTPTEFHLFDLNLPLMAQWIRRHYDAQQLVVAGIIFIALFYQWDRKPLLIRCSLVIVIPLFCLGIFLGVLNEWRAFTDLYSPMLMLIIGSVGTLFGVTARPEREPVGGHELLARRAAA